MSDAKTYILALERSQTNIIEERMKVVRKGQSLIGVSSRSGSRHVTNVTQPETQHTTTRISERGKKRTKKRNGIESMLYVRGNYEGIYERGCGRVGEQIMSGSGSV